MEEKQNKSIRIFLSQAIWNANEFSIFQSARFYGNNKGKKKNSQKLPKKAHKSCEYEKRVRVCERLEDIDQQWDFKARHQIIYSDLKNKFSVAMSNIDLLWRLYPLASRWNCEKDFWISKTTDRANSHGMIK